MPLGWRTDISKYLYICEQYDNNISGIWNEIDIKEITLVFDFNNNSEISCYLELYSLYKHNMYLHLLQNVTKYFVFDNRLVLKQIYAIHW